MDTKRIVEHLTELELAAQDLLEDRQAIVALDRKRNQTREARTAIKNRIKDKNPLMDGNKTWMCYGNMFIKMKNETVLTVLDNSYKKLDDEIKVTRDGLKDKLNKVRQIEGKSQAAGFNLQSLTSDERQSLSAVL